MNIHSQKKLKSDNTFPSYKIDNVRDVFDVFFYFDAYFVCYVSPR